jgi:hypothetical protein
MPGRSHPDREQRGGKAGLLGIAGGRKQRALSPSHAIGVATGAEAFLPVPIGRMAFSTALRGNAESVTQEVSDAFRDLAGVGFQSKVSRIEEANDSARIVPFECLRARRQEERIVFAPHRQ